MPRKADPDRKKAFEIYKESRGNTDLVEIAKQLNRPPGTIRGWKKKDNWDGQINGTFQKNKRNVPKKGSKKKLSKETLEMVEDENPELTEKQRLFCLYYVKCFNATMAAVKAGYAKDSAHVEGCRLLKIPKIRDEIRRLKGTMRQELFIDAMDVLNKYIQVAFSDITDYISFGQREVQVMGAFGPLYEGKGKNKKPVMKTINYVDFKESSEIDGTIIKEVKQGKEGVSIKFEDKTKALEKLEKYFDLLPDKFQRKLEEEKLKIAQQKLELEKLKADELSGEEDADDGFIEALKGSVKEVWADET